MNERIRELAEQAHSYACKYAQQPDYNPHNPYNQGMYKQRYDSKFAQLLIQECATLTLDHRSDDYYQGWLDYRDEIQRHFGVEE